MIKNQIILYAEGELNDKFAREWLKKIQRSMDKINDRTKKHTREIQQLEKKVNELEKKNENHSQE